MPESAAINRVATMKKRIFIILVSVVLVVGCSYFLTGKLIQQSYYDTIAKINSQTPGKVSLVTYQRGLFHSKVAIKVALNGTEVPIQQTVTHGPLVIAKTSKGSSLKLLASRFLVISFLLSIHLLTF